MLFLAMSWTLGVQFTRIQKLFYDAQYSIPRMFQILNPSKFQYSPSHLNFLIRFGPGKIRKVSKFNCFLNKSPLGIINKQIRMTDKK